MTTRQLDIERNFTLEERIKLCHSRIPKMRHITGFVDTGLIAPLPIWSPVPKKYQRTAHDDFSVTGLEAQHPKYLPEILKPFVRIGRHGKNVFLTLSEGVYNK